MSQTDYKKALSCFTTGVAIVTTRAENGQSLGLTINTFTSVSLEPRLILWCIDDQCHSKDEFLKAPYFTVHILSEAQGAIAMKFASSGETDRFLDIDTFNDAFNTPCIKGCAAYFHCRLQQSYVAGDHSILIGQVDDFSNSDEGLLVYQRGQFLSMNADSK